MRSQQIPSRPHSTRRCSAALVLGGPYRPILQYYRCDTPCLLILSLTGVCVCVCVSPCVAKKKCAGHPVFGTGGRATGELWAADQIQTNAHGAMKQMLVVGHSLGLLDKAGSRGISISSTPDQKTRTVSTS